MISDSVTILDWGASHFAAATFSVSRKRSLRLEAWANEERTPGEEEGAASCSAEAEKAWRRIRRRLGGSWRAVLALPSPPVRITPVTMSDLPPKASRQALDFEARQIAGAAAKGTPWGFRRLGEAGGKVDYVLAMTAGHEVDFRAEILERAGFGLEAVIPQAVSLSSLLRFCPRATGRARALVQIGAATSQLVYQEEERLAVRTLAVGGNSLTRTLADELALPLAEAEGLKRRLCAGEDGGGPRDTPGGRAARVETPAPVEDALHEAFRRTRELFIGRLQLELTRAIVNQRAPSVPALPVDVYLLGGGACVPELCQRLEQKTRLTVRPFDDANVVEWNEAAASMRGIDRLRCVDLAAVAQAQYFDPAGAINLLDASKRRAVSFRRNQPVMLGAAALAAAALVPPLIHYRETADQAGRQAQRIESAVAELDRNRARMAENLQKIRQAQAEVVVWRKFAAARGNWVRFLAELQAKLSAAGDLWLDRLQPLKAGVGPTHVAGVRMAMSGRVLEPESEAAGTSAETRVRSFFQAMALSPFIAALEQERFDRSQDGILGFEVVIRMNRSETL